LPLADVYFELKPRSANLGRVDYDALLAGKPQPDTGAANTFRLYRIGDAVASRNIHAAIYDALRLCKDF
jgi:N-methyl-L-proline demethylase